MTKDDSGSGFDRRAFIKRAGVGAGAYLVGNLTPLTQQRAQAATTGSPTATSIAPFSSHVFCNFGYGPRPGDIERFKRLGSDNQTRLEKYIAQQLDPSDIRDSKRNQKLASAGFSTINKSLKDLWRTYFPTEDEWELRMKPAFEIERAVVLNNVYSDRQLEMRLADFWRSHFNVHGRNYYIGPVLSHYDRKIRRGIFGNFREFLNSIATSTAMMYYLDNRVNSAEGPNENYARELLELHTLGATNFYGHKPAKNVPTGADGIKLGYTENDVKAVARCLTGWTIKNNHGDPHPKDDNSGVFFFRSDWHDYGPKRFLGVPIESRGIGETREVFDILSGHPSVARHICEKICMYFYGASIQAVVDKAAGIFLAQKDAPDQLTKVYRAIFTHPTSRKLWENKSAKKIKRPLESICSALRTLDADISLRFDDESDNWGNPDLWFDSNDFMWQVELTGHFPYGWPEANGFPTNKEAWSGSTALITTFKALNGIVNHWTDRRGKHRIDIVGQTWKGLPRAVDHTPRKLVYFWLKRCWGYVPNDVARRNLFVKFMAQGGPRNQVIDINFDDWHQSEVHAYVSSRLRMLVFCILVSPEFLEC